MKTLTISQARENIYKLADDTIEHNVPVTITTKKGNVVLLSESDFNALQETLFLNSIKGFKESLQEIDSSSDEEWLKENEVEW